MKIELNVHRDDKSYTPSSVSVSMSGEGSAYKIRELLLQTIEDLKASLGIAVEK